jgi:ABC-type bacteriocin/lantibiotic exporter with double-glycine peptidase domain
MFIRSVITIIISLIILGFISWQLTLVTLAGVIPIVSIGIFFARLFKE